MATLGKMISIVSQAFEGDTDKGGKPYILHCLHVMNAVTHLGPEAMIVAVAHDLLEDKPKLYSAGRLLTIGFADSAVSRIVRMTHLKGETYSVYLVRVGEDEVTRKIKREDLKHNMRADRMKGLREKDFIRLQKYQYAYTYLKLLDKIDQAIYNFDGDLAVALRAEADALLPLIDDAEMRQKAA